MRITAARGDLADVTTDVVVSPTDTRLRGTGGASRAIHTAAGARLDAACRLLLGTTLRDGLSVGDAVATPAFGLAARWVVHTVGPNRARGQVDAGLLASCYTRSLDVAAALGARTVAFPAVGTGANGWAPDDAARIAVDAVRAWRGDGIDEVRFVVADDATLGAFEAALATAPPEVARAYELARAGAWSDLLLRWRDDERLARQCSRHRQPGSGWTFLHQAAYFGVDEAIRVLVRWGADVGASSADGRTSGEVAAARGHEGSARLLEQAARGASAPLWTAPQDPCLLPGSSAWGEATERRDSGPLEVAYGGGVVRIEPGRRRFVDAFGRTLVGWHGTFDPPLGMAGEPMVGPLDEPEGPRSVTVDPSPRRA